jgi:hypothetical protein
VEEGISPKQHAIKEKHHPLTLRPLSRSLFHYDFDFGHFAPSIVWERNHSSLIVNITNLILGALDVFVIQQLRFHHDHFNRSSQTVLTATLQQPHRKFNRSPNVHLKVILSERNHVGTPTAGSLR